MKTLLVMVLIVIPRVFQAQEIQNKNLHALINSEKAFAAMAAEKNTWEAFLHFLSDRSVTFGPDGPTDGKKQWEGRPVNESLLSWKPVFADMAASGDWGFDYGPWEFKSNRTDENPVAFGHFVTVWRKESSGEWKVALDIGVAHPKGSTPSGVRSSSIQSKSI